MFMVTAEGGEDTRSPSRTTQPLVFHYHIFKNAGTSVDEVLKLNFGSAWAEAEFPWPNKKPSNVDRVTEYLKNHRELSAFSSHTALLPTPKLDDRDVFPIFFVRHPIDRLQSAYTFERTQEADTFGAQLAKEKDFAGYLAYLIEDPVQRQARNFQTHRFACHEPPSQGTELERANRALDALPFVGLVEKFAVSIERLRVLLTPMFPDFAATAVHKNQTRQASRPLADKLASIRAEIGDELYDKLLAANADDLALFEIVENRYRTA
jgi:hypothetical protein